MSQKLEFAPWTDDNQTSLVQFVLLYQAFLGTADNPNRARNLEETRQAIKVLDALADISEVVSAGNGAEGRVLKREGGTLAVDATGLDLLRRSVEAYVGTVPFAMAKTAIELKDFVDKAAA